MARIPSTARGRPPRIGPVDPQPAHDGAGVGLGAGLGLVEGGRSSRPGARVVPLTERPDPSEGATEPVGATRRRIGATGSSGSAGPPPVRRPSFPERVKPSATSSTIRASAPTGPPARRRAGSSTSGSSRAATVPVRPSPRCRRSCTASPSPPTARSTWSSSACSSVMPCSGASARGTTRPPVEAPNRSRPQDSRGARPGSVPRRRGPRDAVGHRVAGDWSGALTGRPGREPILHAHRVGGCRSWPMQPLVRRSSFISASKTWRAPCTRSCSRAFTTVRTGCSRGRRTRRPTGRSSGGRGGCGPPPLPGSAPGRHRHRRSRAARSPGGRCRSWAGEEGRDPVAELVALGCGAGRSSEYSSVLMQSPYPLAAGGRTIGWSSGRPGGSSPIGDRSRCTSARSSRAGRVELPLGQSGVRRPEVRAGRRIGDAEQQTHRRHDHSGVTGGHHRLAAWSRARRSRARRTRSWKLFQLSPPSANNDPVRPPCRTN